MSTNYSDAGRERTWDDWSDRDVSKKITELKSKYLCDKLNYSVDESSLIADKDYCYDPSAMWPIIVANGISLLQQDNPEGWCAFRWDNDAAEHWHKNPLRAAAIVFLEMNGVKPNV